MNPRSVSSIDEMITIVQKHENSKTPTTSYGPPPPPPEPPPPSNLDLPGNRDDIHKFNVPVGKRPYLVGFDISENYDTSLHIATSANISKTVEKFVKNHVCHLTMEQLELQNKYHNTSLCIVSTNGYVRIVKTMCNDAEMGNTEFIAVLIQHYLELLWKKNDDEQTIFHVSVTYCDEGICNLLHEIGSMKDMITPLKDKEGNNMLHLVRETEINRLQDVSEVFQMQYGLLWFKEVEVNDGAHRRIYSLQMRSGWWLRHS